MDRAAILLGQYLGKRVKIVRRHDDDLRWDEAAREILDNVQDLNIRDQKSGFAGRMWVVVLCDIVGIFRVRCRIR